jgi:pimeloyl-ACP methyl ester carboxylesterase
MQLTGWPDPFRRALVDHGFRVIRFDNRDIGLSTHFDHLPVPNVPWLVTKGVFGLPIRAPYSLADMAADAIGLVNALGIDTAHLVGASMGGMIAQLGAALFPQRVRSLTSMMSSSGARHLPRPTRSALAALMGKPDDPSQINRIVDHYMDLFRVIGSPGFENDLDDMRAQLTANIRRSYHPAGSARQLHAIMAAGDRSDMLRRIACPALVIHGADDPLVPVEAGHDTAAKIPGARLKIIPGMGHDLPPGVQPILVDAIVEHCRLADGVKAGVQETARNQLA